MFGGSGDSSSGPMPEGDPGSAQPGDSGGGLPPTDSDPADWEW